MNFYQCLYIQLLVFCAFFSSFVEFFSDAKTHHIYWNPLNIIFRVKPSVILHVEPRDEVIFICPKDEYFILWTYNKQAFENCSLWFDRKFVTNILYRCSYENRVRNRPRPHNDTKDWPLLSAYPTAYDRSANVTARTYGIRQPQFINNFGQRGHRRRRQVLPNVKRSQRYSHLPGSEVFTLLVNELAWSSGTPSFQKGRPVFFTAQPNVCTEENMRLTIVQGEFSWQDKDSQLMGRNASPRPTKSSSGQKDPTKRSFGECGLYGSADCMRSRNPSPTSGTPDLLLQYSFILCSFYPIQLLLLLHF